MAKQMRSLQLVIEVPYAGGVQGAPKLAQVNYSTCESTDPSLVSASGLHVSEGVPADISAPDLADTLTAFINDQETAAKSKEGI